ncbi:Cna B-type domain-containing protein [[Clostridium] symbiosum]|nr:Cna B-type domain-containing protein [[Clostridium] symbiosum]MBS6220113.1 Cna B-type domain-containing protein [[Clostridium] symbiosum]MDM8135535.1 Cna B-type domain-containing protein [[Clostridium] symbiosum]MDM8138934.1 Cna B-type domain-containing protein [[Clostridium] symbiosum]MDM8319838.1 Cna B-type domain-containing protein [[Clostridium] symbiosum]SUY61317.1 Collagen adhesin precursor [[Clostridium] symbiosum]
MNNILNFMKKNGAIALCLIATMIFATTTTAYAGMNNLGPGDDYEFDVPVETEPSTNTQIVIDIVNTHEIYLVDVTGTKTWVDNNDQDGTRPDEITIHLYADGEDTGKSTTLSEATNWKYSFKNLPQYKDGSLIDYTVIEEVPEGYTVDYIVGD